MESLAGLLWNMHVDELEWAERARPHDLRRTVRTNLSKLKVSKDIAERIMNHKEKGISGVYDRHDYLEEKEMALSKWNKRLHTILKGKKDGKADIVKFPKQKNVKQ